MAVTLPGFEMEEINIYCIYYHILDGLNAGRCAHGRQPCNHIDRDHCKCYRSFRVSFCGIMRTYTISFIFTYLLEFWLEVRLWHSSEVCFKLCMRKL
jgi:hypothetical protein